MSTDNNTLSPIFILASERSGTNLLRSMVPGSTAPCLLAVFAIDAYLYEKLENKVKVEYLQMIAHLKHPISFDADHLNV